MKYLYFLNIYLIINITELQNCGFKLKCYLLYRIKKDNPKKCNIFNLSIQIKKTWLDVCFY